MNQPTSSNHQSVSPLFFVSLLFLFFPLYYAQFTPYRFLGIASTGLFAACYLLILYRKEPLLHVFCWFYMLFYIVVFSFGAHLNHSLSLFYLSNLLSYHFSEGRLTYRTVSYALLFLAIVGWIVFGPHEFEFQVFLLVIHLFGLGMYLGTLYHLRHETLQEKLQEQEHSISLLLTENERNRIGRDLHDTLGHVFVMLAIKADLIHTLIDRGKVEEAKGQARELQVVAKQSMAEVRQIIQAIQLIKVADEIRILQQLLTLSDVNCEILGLEIASRLPKAIQYHLSMILRELGNNLLKHSQARNCRFQFTEEGGFLVLLYEDDGCGFASLKGDELTTIKNRLVRIKGELQFVSLSQPTRLAFRLPKEEEET